MRYSNLFRIDISNKSKSLKNVNSDNLSKRILIRMRNYLARYIEIASMKVFDYILSVFEFIRVYIVLYKILILARLLNLILKTTIRLL